VDYRKIYNDLVIRGKNRQLECYKESHHIIPKCMGGEDNNSNLVDLTPEEHYVAHQLLTKIYPENYALAKAAGMMIASRPSNKLYGWLRRRIAKAQSYYQGGEKNSQYGTRWVHNPETEESKKIKGDIEDGWVFGRYKEPKPPKVYKKDIKKQEYIKIYTEYYEIYDKVGFDEFVRITGYRYSNPNLVQMFLRHVEGFSPQNGKKR
jgi:hypothetical protein